MNTSIRLGGQTDIIPEATAQTGMKTVMLTNFKLRVLKSHISNLFSDETHIRLGGQTV